MYNLTLFLAVESVCSTMVLCCASAYFIRAGVQLPSKKGKQILGVGAFIFFVICTICPLIMLPRYFEVLNDFWRMKICYSVLFVLEVIFFSVFVHLNIRQNSAPRKENGRNTAVLVIAFSFLLLVLYLFADFFNVPSALGIVISCINSNILGIVVSTITTISIFGITFFCVEQWNLKRQNNQKELAEYLLKYTYSECLVYINHLELPNVVERLVKRTDFSAYYNKKTNPAPYMGYSEIPFEHDDFISNCIMNGILSKEQVEVYFKIKHDYSAYVMSRITLFDAPEVYEPLRENLITYIKKYGLCERTKEL